MLLIYPPAAKPSEPPAGIAKLSGALTAYGIKHTLLDANIEALLYNLDRAADHAGRTSDKWTSRAVRNIRTNHSELKGWRLYRNMDRYKRAVADLNRAVEMTMDKDTTLGLANYRSGKLSPLRSADLFRAADNPQDNAFYPYFKERLPHLIYKESPSVVGLSLNYLSQAICTFAMIGFLRQNFPGLKIILGGGLVSSWMSNPQWSNPFEGLVDDLISGPGEDRLLALAGTVSTTGDYYTPDYDSLPLTDYLAPGVILPYSASSGCYWNNCSFCPEKAEDHPYVPVPGDKAMADLKIMVARTGPVLVHLLDNAVSPGLLKRLAETPLGVPWYGFARINRQLTDIDFCMALRRSGCVMLKLGLESGDQGVLDKMNKGINLETASLALKTLERAGIATYLYLIFGTPPETLPAARRTLDFVIRHKNGINFLNLAIFNMPVCAEGVLELETRKFYDGDLSLYTGFVHPEGWDRKEVRQFLDNEFRKNSAVSEILKNDPPLFTSNHAPFFVMHDR